MTKRMLIDTTHAEETRVVVLDGNRLEDYDVETSAKKQLKGNIYLAKVIRVEPSLQAAFVEYGGNRHGFLAFSEIHPDYYQIPVADRERLIAIQEEEARAEDAREEAREQAREAAGEAAENDGGRTDQSRQDFPEALAVDGHADGHNEDGSASGTSQSYSDSSNPDDDNSGEEQSDDNQQVQAPEVVGGESDSNDDGRGSPQSARFLRQYKIQEVIRRRQILLIQVVKEERGNKGAALTTYISLAGRFCVLMPNSLRGGGVSRKITSAADRRRLKEITTELEIPRGMAMIIRTAGAQRPRPEIRRDCEYLLRLWDDIREQTLRASAPALIYEEANLIKRAIRDVYTRDIEEIAVDGEQGWKAAREFMRNLMPANAQKVILWRDQGQPLFSYYQVEHHLDGMLQPTVQLRSGGYLVINQTEALVAIDVNSGRSTRERGIEETALRTNLEAADEVARQLRLRDLAGLIVIDFIDMEARKHNAMVERRLKEALKNDRARIQLGQISHFGLMEMSRQRLRPSIAESSFVTCPHCAGTGFMRGTDSAALHVLRAIEEEGGKQRAAEILVYAASSVSLYVLNHKRVWLAEIEQRHRMVVNFATDDSLIPPEVRIDKIRPQVAAPLPVASAVADFARDRDESVQPVATSIGSHTRTSSPDTVVSHDRVERFEADEPEEFGNDQAAAAETPEAAIPGILQDNVPSTQSAEGNDEERKRKRRRRRRRGGRREDAANVTAPALLPNDAEQPEIQHGGVYAEPAGHEPGAPASDAPRADVVQASSFAADDSEDELRGRASGEVPLSEEPGMTPRKRGRRGGARGRKPREQDTGATIPDDTQPDNTHALAAAYNGPTPANPFGGGFDIFDLIESDVEPAQRPTPEAGRVMPEPVVEAVPASQVEPAELPTIAMPEIAAAETADIVPATPTVAAPDAAPAEVTEPGVGGAAKPRRKRAVVPPAKAAAALVSQDVQSEPVAIPAKSARKTPTTRVAKAGKAEANADVTGVDVIVAQEAGAKTALAKSPRPASAKATKPERASAKATSAKVSDSEVAGTKGPAAKAAAPKAASSKAATPKVVAPKVPGTKVAATRTAGSKVAAGGKAAEPKPAGNVVQPMLIDELEAPPARRTGWWKR